MTLELHCHTTHSDGRLTPEALHALAVKKKLSLLALTDHDTVAGHEALKPLLESSGITFIPGIELTTAENGESIHILGYFPDDRYQDPEFLATLEHLFTSRNTRMEKMIHLLKEHFDLEIDYAALRAKSAGVLTRANLAQAVHAKVPHLTYNEAFMKYLDKSSPAYVPNVRLSVKEGLDLLHQYGAVAILAHPVIYKKNSLESLLTHPFDGVECYYPLNDEAMTLTSLKAARERNLLITAGSDYHGIPQDVKHGELASTTFSPEDLQPFLQRFTP